MNVVILSKWQLPLQQVTKMYKNYNLFHIGFPQNIKLLKLGLVSQYWYLLQHSAIAKDTNILICFPVGIFKMWICIVSSSDWYYETTGRTTWTNWYDFEYH